MSRFVEILIARRIWNFKSTDYNTMSYAIFQIMKDIRRKPVQELAQILEQRLAQEGYDFISRTDFYLTGHNRKQVQRLLARMTEYLELQSHGTSRFSEYIGAAGQKAHEVEHIWANHFDRHTDEFTHENDFDSHRNRIGGLLLLPRSFNASYGDLPYKDKLHHYFGQNLLAQSLHPDAYTHHPGFLKFVKSSDLKFEPLASFKKEQLEQRQQLYVNLAHHVWDPKSLGDYCLSSE